MNTQSRLSHSPLPGLLVVLVIALAAIGAPILPAPARAAAEVVGSGTPASCTSAALGAALAGGGEISFNCGGAPHTIVVTTPFDITAPQTTIDGGGLITLQGQGSQLIVHRTFGIIGSSTLTLRNLTITGGRASGASAAANGGAVESYFEAANPAFKPSLIVENVAFINNDTSTTSFTGDAYDYGGGAIYSRGGSVTVRASSFADNDSANGSGGAIHILQSALTIEDSVFTNNTAIGASPRDSLGGAIYIDGLGGEGGRFRVVRSRFVNNRAYNSGGAIYVNMYENSSRTEIVASSFEDNAVVGGERAQGGAIGGGGTVRGGVAASGNPAIVIGESLFTGNSAKRTAGFGGNTTEDGSGGALAFPQRARLTITNSTFEDNTAFGSSFNANGGALYVVNNSDQFEIVNSTFANNFAGWVGGAISNSKIGDQPGGRVRNTLFVDNSADNGPNDWNIQQHCSSELAHDGRSLQFPGRLTGGNFFNDVTCFQDKSAPAQTADPQFRNPQLQPLADNGGPTRTMAIAAAGPARDAGAGCPTTDQRGVVRPQGAACDLGAYELVAALSLDRSLFAVGAPGRTVVVRGEGFTATSVVQVDGADRPTTFVGAGALRFELSAADVDAPAVLTVSVRGPGSGLSPATLRVVAELTGLNLPLLRR